MGGPDSPEDTDLLMRPATAEDADVLASLFLTAREAAYPAMPRSIHTDEETHAWFRQTLQSGRETWVAEQRGGVVGYLVLDPGWLDALYVRADLTGHGIGSALLALAKSLRPEGFGLWVFVSNEPALRFYRRHGLVEVRRSDGVENEEGEPAVEMAWLGADPVSALRRRIDEVDDQLAALLDHRAVLSARIQQLKEVPGQAGRDAQREAEIVGRMAQSAPHLGHERLGRIMHVVIGESLDAADS